MLCRTITIGSVISFLGMFVTLFGAQQTAELLVSKLLTMALFGVNDTAVSAQTLQPLDILIVQASTNILLSHS